MPPKVRTDAPRSVVAARFSRVYPRRFESHRRNGSAPVGHVSRIP
jgi:hypothetical protein